MKYVRILVSILAMCTITLQVVPIQRAQAVTAADWKAGRIVDDNIFTNAKDMSVNDIQNFLNNLVPSCDTNGTQPATEYGRPDMTHAQYAASRGWAAPPYACLRNYYEVPKTSPSPGIPDNSYNHGGGAFAGGVSAAQLIYDAAQQYQINPKVLLVKLRTESAGPLTNDSWPLQKQYIYAMGAHCPDSGPGGSANCDPNYAGFSIQISESAALLRWYLDSMTQSWWQYKKPYRVNNILWNVAPTGCGGGDVFIESKATAALYTYTPYQPNAAALANMYSTGDGCSAYGNRNFWRVYRDWFGSTLNPQYAASYSDVSNYSDQTKTTSVPAHIMLTGQRSYMVLRFKNTGDAAWHNSGQGAVRLAVTNGTSAFCDSSWLNCQRPAAMKESIVNPGEMATFEFWYTTPTITQNTTYTTRFGVVAEAIATMQGDQQVQTTSVQRKVYSATYQSVENFTDDSMTGAMPANRLTATTKTYMVLRFKNTGNITWYRTGAGAIRLATPNTLAGNQFCDTSWLSCSRPAAMAEDSVAPGGTATFSFWYRAPSVNVDTTFLTKFSVVSEAVSMMDGAPQWQTTRVEWPRYYSAYTYIENYTDQTKTVSVPATPLSSGQRTFMVLHFQNTSNIPWYKSGTGAVRLMTASPSTFCDSTWLSCQRPAELKESVVYPGQTGTFEFWYHAPTVNKGSSFVTRFGTVAEAVSVMAGPQQVQTTLVQ